MPLLSSLILKWKTETLPIFESPEARAISVRYVELLRLEILPILGNFTL